VVGLDTSLFAGRVMAEGKPEKIIDKMIEGRLSKFYEEICLMEQPFVKDNTMKIEDLIKTKIAKLGENISIARFVRFKVGDSSAAE
jgi:elongation factor Ts